MPNQVADQGDELRVAAMETGRIRFEELNQRMLRLTGHKTLSEARIQPMASRFHYEVAWTILQAGNIPVHEANGFVEAILLLQQGLSIHDEVDAASGLGRQLLVLAGDYCSSRYYWVISQTGNESLIRALSEAVVRINEAKMTLHHRRGPMPWDEYMALRETIEGELLYTLARHCNLETSTWVAQIRSLVRAHVVKEDMGGRKGVRPFTIRQAYEWLSDAIDRLLHLQANAILQPISLFLLDYLSPTKKLIEAQASIEGNRR